MDFQRCSRIYTTASQIEQQIYYETQQITRFKSRIETLESEKKELVKAVGTIDRAVQIISANGIGKIEGIVSDGLQRVFGKPELGLFIEKKETARGNSYRLLIRKGDIIGNPMDSFGGGVQNVAAFLLRVILVKRFRCAKVLCLDEQFSNVSVEFQPKVSDMLKTLAKMGFTIFAISHQPAITAAADHIYQVVSSADGPKLLRG